ncbi:hypothetical protein ACXC9Q_29695 [Kribbella sp. CWNU-51]
MNDQDIETALGAVTTASEPLDPARVIAGARRRRRRGVATGVASAGVVAAVAVGVLAGWSRPAVEAPVAGVPAPPATTTPAPSTPLNGYVFQNTKPAMSTLAAGAEVKVGSGLYFTTRGTKWALIERKMGQPESEPFGWRRTVGDPNLGDPTSPGIQSADGVVSSVFKSPEAATVVYTQGRKAWYAMLYRLAGIPGWVQSSAQVPVPAPATPAGPGTAQQAVAVFVYDGAGKLLTAFGNTDRGPLG